MFRKNSFSFFYDRPLLSLFICFFISILIRLPNLNRPLSKHHELNAALVLINAEEWNHSSPAFYHYVPVHSYHQPGDLLYKEDIADGHSYLVNNSFGSLWYIMPYVFFKLMQSQPSPLLLQVFNLLLHLITVLLVYKLAFYFFKDESGAVQKALVTSVMYLFSPALLWFHGNGYVHEIAVLPFIYATILVYLQLLERRGSPIYKYLFLGVLIIAGINCDWLMCFVAAALFIHAARCYVLTRRPENISLLLVLSIAAVLAITIIVVQFSSFMGFQNYIQGLAARFLLRGIGGETHGGGLSKSAGIVSFYLAGYGAIIPLIIVCLLCLKQYRQNLISNQRLRYFILSGAIVCLLHHVIFFGFTNIHDYSVVKAGFILSAFSCIAIFSLKGNTKKMLVMVTVLIINISTYYYINRPGKYAANGQPYSYFKTLGERIKAISSPDDYIFIDTPEMSLLLTYYSKRLYRNVNNAEEANKFFKELPGNNALFIHTENFEFLTFTSLKK